MVAKGYTQKYGSDFQETFSPVVKISTVRCISALAASHNWKLYRLDNNNAFFHRDLHEELYMKIFEGVPNPSNLVCRLNKSLYGLSQASRQWFSILHHALLLQGYRKSKNDYFLFIKSSGIDLTVIVFHVDKVFLTGSNTVVITSLKL